MFNTPPAPASIPINRGSEEDGGLRGEEEGGRNANLQTFFCFFFSGFFGGEE